MLLTSPTYWSCPWSISQGELIDRIEHHVVSSRGAVESAGGQIKVAGKQQRRARKVTCKDGGD
jgi:t-SNARE complex subunit (syntaxin)